MIGESSFREYVRVPKLPSEFSLFPFWFWNDRLEEAEILRQIADFEDHGVTAFVLHPRVGLPRDMGFMSETLLGFMSVAIEEAARRGMKVLLYDEGMYPSGSASGLVVASNPSLACRGLAIHETPPTVGKGIVVATLERAEGRRFVVDRQVNAVIRGLHFGDEAFGEKDEDTPPAGDILNPRTADAVIRIVYEKYREAFGRHFGTTVLGIFTDEPNPLGRVREKNVRPYTTGLLPWVSERLGYDFGPHLGSLFFDDAPDAARQRERYDWAIHRRLEESWFAPLQAWCEGAGVALCGHPDRGDEIGVQKFFSWPGQDLVWRWVVPGEKTGVEGPESTQGKVSSSAMIHAGKRRNSNEFCGAYGQETTFEEYAALANWCLVRGVNLLIPHAFYYSVRGPRKDERPPQVGGVGCSWWAPDTYRPFAEHCARVCEINTDSVHVCDVAVLAPPDHCPWPAAKFLLEHQRDFNYLDLETFEKAAVTAEGVSIGGMTYRALVLDGAYSLSDKAQAALSSLGDRALTFPFEPGALERIVRADVRVEGAGPGLRYRHVVKEGRHYVFFFNEARGACSFEARFAEMPVTVLEIDTGTGVERELAAPYRIELGPFGTALLSYLAGSP